MEEIDLKELFNMFWSRKLIIILIVAIFVGIGVFYSKFMIKPDYKSYTTLVLTKNRTDNDSITQSEITLNQKLVATYKVLIESNNVLRQVISNLNSDISEETLRKAVSINLSNGTQLIEISVTNENPETAKLFASEITNVFIEKAKEIYKIDNISLVDEAKVSTKPYNINHVKNITIFAFIGIIIATVYVFIVAMLDTTIKKVDETEKRLGLNVLASIPNYNYEIKKKGKK